MNRLRSFFKDKRGSFALEAAIAIFVLILFMLFLLLTLYSRLISFCWHTAAVKTSQEASLYIAAAGVLDLNQVIPDSVHKMASEVPKQVQDIGEDVFASFLSSSYLEKQLNYWFLKTAQDRKIYTEFMHSKEVYLEIDDANHLVWLNSKLRVPVVFGTVTIRDRTPIPMWNMESIFLNPKEDKKDEDNIWSWHNFKRGRYFRDKYGGNLPSTFPTLAGFSGGNALVIKSIDLTAPSYQDESALRQHVQAYINDLAQYQGQKPWGKDNIEIKPGDITSRTLKIVIPTNAPESLKAVLRNMSASQVNIQIIEYKESKRFTQTDED